MLSGSEEDTHMFKGLLFGGNYIHQEKKDKSQSFIPETKTHSHKRHAVWVANTHAFQWSVHSQQLPAMILNS